MVLIGESLNFANVIALPLLLGVGVAFKILHHGVALGPDQPAAINPDPRGVLQRADAR